MRIPTTEHVPGIWCGCIVYLGKGLGTMLFSKYCRMIVILLSFYFSLTSSISHYSYCLRLLLNLIQEFQDIRSTNYRSESFLQEMSSDFKTINLSMAWRQTTGIQTITIWCIFSNWYCNKTNYSNKHEIRGQHGTHLKNRGQGVRNKIGGDACNKKEWKAMVFKQLMCLWHRGKPQVLNQSKYNNLSTSDSLTNKLIQS